MGRSALLACALIAMSACDTVIDVDLSDQTDVLGSGFVITESRALASFTAVHASGGHEVVVRQADVEGVEITTDDNLIPFVRTDVIDGALVISVDPQVRLIPTEPLVVLVYAGAVSELLVSGAIVLDADVGSVAELTIHVSGASLVCVTGSAEWQALQISGASAYHGLGLESNEAWVAASGASLAELWVHDQLEVDGSGASTIRYRGRPGVIARVTGGSTVAPIA